MTGVRTPHERSADLAEIILADSQSRPAERVRMRLPHRSVDRARSQFDATSVALMALVLMGIAVVLAVIFGGLGSEDAPSTDGPSTRTTAPDAQRSGERAVPRSEPAAAPKEAAASAFTPSPGVQLAVGRITASVATDGTSNVVVRARVTNVGAKASSSGTRPMIALLVDGQVVGMRPATIGAATKGAAAVTVPFRVESCSTGTHSVTVVADATAVIDEADESDNSRSTQLEWTCAY